MRTQSATLSVHQRRLAAQSLRATADRLALGFTPELAPVASVVRPQEATMAQDLIAQLQSLLAGLTPAPAVAPVAPAPTPKVDGLKKAQAYWQTDYPGKGIPVRQLASGTWVDAKGVFAKAPKAAPKPAPAPKAAAPVNPQADLLAQLAALLGAATPAPVAKAAAAPVSKLASLVRADGPWLRCLHCDDAYWGSFRDEAWVIAKASKHVASKHKA